MEPIRFDRILHDIFWYFRRYKHRINFKPYVYHRHHQEIIDWLIENAKCGWRIRYISSSLATLAVVGVDFKNLTEAVMFKMIVNDF